MRINYLLGFLWLSMILSMLLKWKIDTYMVVALIVIPILIVLLDLQEELNQLKEELKHQRKFVLDRYNLLSEKVSDLSNNMEKKIVVDFSEFAKENLPTKAEPKKKKKAKPKKSSDEASAIDLTVPTQEQTTPESQS